jgi:hypothetical protein
MWGFPFLIAGEGLDRETGEHAAHAVRAGRHGGGPMIGVLVQRHPLRRSWLVLGIIAVNAGAWGLVLGLAGPRAAAGAGGAR